MRRITLTVVLLLVVLGLATTARADVIPDAAKGVRAAVAGAGEQRARRNVFQRRYVLVFANVGREADREKLLGIMKRAAPAGYNGIVLGARAGEYIGLLRRGPPASYAAAFATVRKAAESLHLALIPYAINANEVGYAAPELAEAIPCRGTPFRVRDASAEAVAEPAQLLTSPGFEVAGTDVRRPWCCGHREQPVVFTDSGVRSCLLSVARAASDPPEHHEYQRNRARQGLAS